MDWRQAWRQWIAPRIPTDKLELLRKALLTNSPNLIQGDGPS
jgi:hypothetical protein